MGPRIVAAILVALLVVFAGCTGTGGEGPDPASGDTDDMETTTETADSTSAPDDDGDGDDADPTPSGDGDDAVLGDPAGILTDAQSFTAGWTYSLVEDDDTQAAYEYTVAVDLATNRSREWSRTFDDADEVVFERYNADGQSYVKFGSEDQALYMVSPQETSPFEDAVSDAIVGDFEDYERVGTETFDGVTVTRYEYSDPLLWQTYGLGTVGDADDVEVTDFTLAVLVDGDGLTRSVSWTLSGEEDDGTPVAGEWRYTLTKIGATTVEEPAWLELAKTQGGMSQDF